MVAGAGVFGELDGDLCFLGFLVDGDGFGGESVWQAVEGEGGFAFEGGGVFDFEGDGGIGSLGGGGEFHFGGEVGRLDLEGGEVRGEEDRALFGAGGGVDAELPLAGRGVALYGEGVVGFVFSFGDFDGAGGGDAGREPGDVECDLVLESLVAVGGDLEVDAAVLDGRCGRGFEGEGEWCFIGYGDGEAFVGEA